ncbi:hypothetical protein [Hymenobacter pini]|uniref:hypothetical protein n=1 Tax=Hymenobacter pini TaxID=2880879 RepID=UPI001CF5906E|nr:hypothetical protein [Hymenobacter pini]MCA8829063.1 hypothetical protein [Hymenobacter pini]
MACFVDDSWPETERQTALQYLWQGRPLHYWMGMQRCLLGCGKYLHTTGYTDGTYYWPESLLHYVAVHAVRLPDAFVQYVHQQSEFPADAAAIVDEVTQANYSWWKTQAGWYSESSSLQHLGQQEIRDFLRRYDRQHIDYSGLTSPTDIAALERMVTELRQLANL